MKIGTSSSGDRYSVRRPMRDAYTRIHTDTHTHTHTHTRTKDTMSFAESTDFSEARHLVLAMPSPAASTSKADDDDDAFPLTAVAVAADVRDVRGDDDGVRQFLLSSDDDNQSPVFVDASSTADGAAGPGGGGVPALSDGGGHRKSRGGSGSASGRPKPSVHIMDPPVSEIRGYTVIKIEEKHGAMHRAIPVMPLSVAVLCCLLNIFLPGIGETPSSVHRLIELILVPYCV